MSLTRNMLFGSLLLNAALAGYAASLAFHPPAPPAPPQMDAPPEFLAFSSLRQIRRLPPEERAAARAAIEAGLPQTREAALGTRDALQTVAAILREEPFDADAAREAAGRLGEARSRQTDATVNVIIDVLETMTPERRAEFLSARRGGEGRPRPGEFRERLRERRNEDASEAGNEPQP